jgi:CRAL/TRIO domain
MKYSFDHLGTFNGLRILYTVPSRVDNIVTEEQLQGLFALVNAQKQKKWLWILDLKDMSYSKCMSVSFIGRLISLLKEEHAASLQGIWILNMNSWAQMILSMFTTTKVRILSDEPLELFSSMKSIGLNLEQQNQLFTSITVSSN